MLQKYIAVFIAIFIVFKVYFFTLTFSNLTLWSLLGIVIWHLGISYKTKVSLNLPHCNTTLKKHKKR